MPASRDDCKGERTAQVLDKSQELLQYLLAEKVASRASGRYGVLIVLDDGYPTKVVALEESTYRMTN